jgi:2-oxo-hept-3-ene-1,7-dioate hydratase
MVAENAAFAAMIVGRRMIRPMVVDIRRVGATLSTNGMIEEFRVAAANMGHLAAGTPC